MVMLLFIQTLPDASAQCAISYSKAEGIVGYSYRGKDDPPTTEADCEAKANVQCKQKGGSNCLTVYRGDREGWCGIVVGYNEKFLRTWIAIDAIRGSRADAEHALMNEFHSKGGKDIKTPQVYVWYVKGHY